MARARSSAFQASARGDGQRRRYHVAVGAAVFGQTGEHQPQCVQQLGSGAEGTADAGDPGPLVQRQRRRHVQNLIHLRPGRLCHAPPGIGRERFQITSGAFGVEDPKSERGFAGAGDSGDSDDLIQRDIDVDVFQIVYSGAADLNGFRRLCPVVH